MIEDVHVDKRTAVVEVSMCDIARYGCRVQWRLESVGEGSLSFVSSNKMTLQHRHTVSERL